MNPLSGQGLQVGEQVRGFIARHPEFAIVPPEQTAGVLWDKAEAFAEAGWLIRRGFQYHWRNEGYRTFDDFLARLNHSKRKTIKRERREVTAQGLSVEMLTGAALTPAHWDAFFELYIATSDRKWGSPYLTREFFHEIGRVMPERVALVLARHGERYEIGRAHV